MAATYTQLRASLDAYEAALSRKDPTGVLARLDELLSHELRQRIRARRESDGAAYLEKDELEDVMRWKLKRGKFRPTLMGLIGKNTPEEIKTQTRLLDSLLHPKDDDDKEAPTTRTEQDSQRQQERKREALDAGCKLKGVGPATCSALLCLFSDGAEAFMSDEALLHAAGMKGAPKYNAKEWAWFADKMQERIDEEGWENVEALEKAAWAWAHRGKEVDGDAGVDPVVSEEKESGKKTAAATKKEGRKTSSTTSTRGEQQAKRRKRD